MSQTLLEKHEPLVVEIAHAFLNNMEVELGKKYKKNDHHVNAGLSDAQYDELRTKYEITANDFSELYSAFMKMQPTKHLQQVMEAFSASGGNVDIEPVFDEETQRLNVNVIYAIKDNRLEKIEGLTPIEQVFLKMNALLQIEKVLADADQDSPAF